MVDTRTPLRLRMASTVMVSHSLLEDGKAIVHESTRRRLCRFPNVCSRWRFGSERLLLLVFRRRSVIEGGVDPVEQMLPARCRRIFRRVARPGAGLQDRQIGIEIRVEKVRERIAIL